MGGEIVSEKYYKVLGPNRTAHHGGSGQWPEPGTWLETLGPLELCEAGTLHLCRRQDLIHWLGPEIWIAEADGEVLVGKDKIGCLRARLVSRCDGWTEKSARLLACDFAERALLHERLANREPDPRSWDAVATSRRYARGEAIVTELLAAWDAAGAAAWDAARAAAEDAAWAAAEDAAWAAAGVAARAAAGAAAGDAAGVAERDAALAAERAWQTEQLVKVLEG